MLKKCYVFNYLLINLFKLIIFGWNVTLKYQKHYDRSSCRNEGKVDKHTKKTMTRKVWVRNCPDRTNAQAVMNNSGKVNHNK